MIQSHANRGRQFEREIKASFDILQRQRSGVGLKVETPMVQQTRGSASGNFTRTRSVADFVGVVQGVPLALELKVHKETKAPRWNPARVKPWQVEFLGAWYRARGAAGVLVDVRSGSQGLIRLGVLVIPYTAIVDMQRRAATAARGNKTIDVRKLHKDALAGKHDELRDLGVWWHDTRAIDFNLPALSARLLPIFETNKPPEKE